MKNPIRPFIFVVFLFSLVFCFSCDVISSPFAPVSFEADETVESFFHYESYIDHTYGHTGTWHTLVIRFSLDENALSDDSCYFAHPVYVISVDLSAEVDMEYAEMGPTMPFANKTYQGHVWQFIDGYASTVEYSGSCEITINHNLGSFGAVGGEISSVELSHYDNAKENFVLNNIRFNVFPEADRGGIE